MPEPLIGKMLGEYRVDRVLGAGGMGVVYEATQPALERKVAIKILRKELAGDPRELERLLKEARLAGSIRHRGIVALHTVGDLPGGGKYLVMEHLEGETLERLMRREGKVPLERALPVLDEVLGALSAAHSAGVVHRDIKPANIFLARQSNGTSCVKLMDFGLARRFDTRTSAGRAWTMAGTPEYLSPEQIEGTQASPRTDLYGFGVTAFELLSGGLPFGGRSVQDYLDAHKAQPAPLLSSFCRVPAELDRLINSLLEKRPEDRPASADLVRRELDRVARRLSETRTDHELGGAGVALEPTASMPAPRLPDSRAARRWGVIAIGVVALGAGMTLATLFSLREVEPLVPAPAVKAPTPAPRPPSAARAAPPATPVDTTELDRRLAALKQQEQDDWEDSHSKGFALGCGQVGWKRSALAEIASLKAQKLAATPDAVHTASVEAQARILVESLDKPGFDCLKAQKAIQGWRHGDE